METMTPDNWWDHNHKDTNLLQHFSDKALQDELSFRQEARRKLEILNIVGKRDPVGYFTTYGGEEPHAEWELNIVFSNGTKHNFLFSTKVKQNETTMNDFRTLYFPHLVRLDYKDYERLVESKDNLRRKKKKVCQSL